jgi:hypothetical protein
MFEGMINMFLAWRRRPKTYIYAEEHDQLYYYY